MKPANYKPGEAIRALPIMYREGAIRRTVQRAGQDVPEGAELDGTEETIYILSFSSTYPVERYFGIEILDHSPGACDLTRFNNGAGSMLWNHNPDVMLGVVDHAQIDKDGVGRALVRFGVDDFAKQKQANVDNDTLRCVSVGYRVIEMKPDKAPGVHRVLKWEPVELSLVSVPADPTVGVGRSLENQPLHPVNFITTETRMPDETVITTASANAAAAVVQSNDTQHRSAVDSILALKSRYDDIITAKDVQEAVRSGANVEKFQELIIERLASGASSVTGKSIGMSGKELERFSFLRAIRSQIPGQKKESGFELEVSTALARGLGRDPEGFFVPPEFFSGKRDFNVGAAGEAGNLVQTSVMSDMFTDVLRPALVLGGLGITILPGVKDNLSIPRKSTAGTIGNVTEVAALTETTVGTTLLSLSPKRIGAFIEPSKQSIIQGELAIEAMLRDDLLTGTAVLIENYGINGTGSAPQPRGIRNVAGVGSVVGGTNGLAFNWGHVTGLEAACANVNATAMSKAGYLINTKVVNTAKNTQKAANLPFIWDNGLRPLNDTPVGRTNNVPSNLTKGSSSGICSSVVYSSDWSMFLLALFGGLDVTVDPYTLSTTGQIRITLNQFIDWGCRQPGCFAVMDDALTP